jgi:hypothetical protein
LVVSETLQLPTGDVYSSDLVIEYTLASGIASSVITWRPMDVAHEDAVYAAIPKPN